MTLVSRPDGVWHRLPFAHALLPSPGGTRRLISLSTVSSLEALVAKLPQPLAQAFRAGEGEMYRWRQGPVQAVLEASSQKPLFRRRTLSPPSTQ